MIGVNPPTEGMAWARADATVRSMSEDRTPTDHERDELERLRAEVLALQREEPPRARWRTAVAALLIVLACLLAPFAVLAVWARNQVTNTDRYVETVTPLAQDPAIQRAIADQATETVVTAVDVERLTNEAVDALAAQGLRPVVAESLRSLAVPLAGGIEDFVRTQVGSVVRSDAFATAWVEANRTAHTELVAVLTGQGGGAVTLQDDTVSVNLAALIAAVKQRLTDSGFALAARIPEVDASFVLFQSADLVRVQAGFNLLTLLGGWLPVIVLALAALGVLVARSHRRALIGVGLGLALAMLVLAVGLTVFRALYLQAVPADVLPQDAAAVLYDTLVRFLRTALRTIALLGLVVAVGALLTGSSDTAVRTRRALANTLNSLRARAESAGLRTGPVGSWVFANQRALRISAVALAGLAFVFWSRPTGRVVLLLTVLLLVVLGLIEFLARPPDRAGGVAPAQGPVQGGIG
jgi:hypothetical protein